MRHPYVRRPPRHARDPRSTRGQRRALERALRRPQAYPHRTGRVRRIETHISIVSLAGPFPYKRCKRIDLGFADFTRPEARYRACADSLRLNRRLAPAIYLAVVEVTGRAPKYAFATERSGHRGPVVDYALKMRRFRQVDLLSARAKRGVLRRDEIERSAERIARFHRRASACPPEHRFGSEEYVRGQIEEVLAGLEREAPGCLPETIAQAQRRLADDLAEHFAYRRAAGFVRECHGDLHLENIVRRGNDVAPFDCIEFSPGLRWIDVTSDLAFLAMDLLAYGRGDLATRLVDRWLLATGDYAGMRALQCYVVYRALVRAYVSILKAPAPTPGETRMIPAAATRYLALARHISGPQSVSLVLCHGFSGSGKSVVADELASHLGAVVVSSDVERKRASSPLAGARNTRMPATAYSSASVDANYRHLASLTGTLLDAGLPVVVDASFLRRSHRTCFLELAKRHGASACIVDVDAPPALLLERLRRRAKSRDEPSDADEAILTRQTIESEPLDASEASLSVTIDATSPREAMRRVEFWQPVLTRVGKPGWLAGTVAVD
ncbi:AAA family ATPase [Trinickia diaoshuihuensis]|uniref:bifunctional aminoglycoside phosphotransferase/ATP-binding protein n=1 Tax=Trinickia diaoshuihuensis TaxID=2292265 RepID=UPI000E25F2D6|nr:AAA family ATPase [Trinickia diaoshuihuensis]